MEPSVRSFCAYFGMVSEALLMRSSTTRNRGGAVLRSIAHMRLAKGTNKKKRTDELHPHAEMYSMAAQSTAVYCAASSRERALSRSPPPSPSLLMSETDVGTWKWTLRCPLVDVLPNNYANLKHTRTSFGKDAPIYAYNGRIKEPLVWLSLIFNFHSRSPECLLDVIQRQWLSYAPSCGRIEYYKNKQAWFLFYFILFSLPFRDHRLNVCFFDDHNFFLLHLPLRASVEFRIE